MGGCITQQTFDLLAIGQKTVNDFFVLGLFPQTRLISQCFFDADGFHAFNGDHLGQPIYLPIWHLQNTTDIAHRGFRQKRTKRDDLAYFVAAVFLLDIADDFLAAIHAKVDIKVRHADTFGVQEPLKQQAIAQRIKVRDG